MFWSIVASVISLIVGGLAGIVFGVYVSYVGATRTGKMKWGDREYRVFPIPSQPSTSAVGNDDGLVRMMRTEINAGSFDAEIGRAIHRNELRRSGNQRG